MTDEQNTEKENEVIDEALEEPSEEVVAEATDDTLDTEDEALIQAHEEIESLKDQLLRTQAETQNLRRRGEKDVENAHKYAAEKFAKELLTVADNMERTLEASNADGATLESIQEGVNMTLKGFFDTLGKFNLEAVDPHGEPFDPNLHQAMSMVENPEVEPNTVIAVIQKGYTLSGRLLRPAMVMVSKGGTSSGGSIDEKA